MLFSGLRLRHHSRSTNLLTPLCNSKNEQDLKCNKNFRGSRSWYKLVILKFSTENDNFLVASLPLKGALFLGKITPLLRCLLHPQLMKAPVFTKKATILDWESNPGPLGSTPGHQERLCIQIYPFWADCRRGGCGCLSTPGRVLSQLTSWLGGDQGAIAFLANPP